MIFGNKILSDDYVELSIGKIYFKELDTGTLNKALIKSTISGSNVNNNLFFMILEKRLIDLKRRQLLRLPIKDGQKIRIKLREILLRYGVISDLVPGSKNDFSIKDKKWFDNKADDMQKHLDAATGMPHG